VQHLAAVRNIPGLCQHTADVSTIIGALRNHHWRIGINAVGLQKLPEHRDVPGFVAARNDNVISTRRQYRTTGRLHRHRTSSLLHISGICEHATPLPDRDGVRCAVVLVSSFSLHTFNNLRACWPGVKGQGRSVRAAISILAPPTAQLPS